ncbi:MAG: hypothetical protein U0223_00605 [Nitrospira sp.]|nr:hypothetical protein [Nitrospira sp.]
MNSEAGIIRPAIPEQSQSTAMLMRKGVSDVVRRIPIMGSFYPQVHTADERQQHRDINLDLHVSLSLSHQEQPRSETRSR